MQEIVGDYPVFSAIALFTLWTLVTYFLEGRLQTLLRPEAMQLRLLYAVVANLGIGILLSGGLLHLATKEHVITYERTGFGSTGHTIVWTVVAAIIGLILYRLQNSRVHHPMIIFNGFTQVWVVSTAEIMVCWAVVGVLVESELLELGDLPAGFAAAIIASLCFGIYHVAHSPPFNTISMIAKLTVVGLVTSLFFFLTRSIYGTLVFHNFLALYGVLQALQKADRIEGYRKLNIPLFVMAAIALVLLVGIHLLYLNN